MNGNVYEGQWARDKKHGKGTYTYYLTNEKYEGEFYENEKRGQGVFTYRFGDRYEGEFYSNEKAGKGTIYYKSGARFEGIWEKVNFKLCVWSLTIFRIKLRVKEHSTMQMETNTKEVSRTVRNMERVNTLMFLVQFMLETGELTRKTVREQSDIQMVTSTRVNSPAV